MAVQLGNRLVILQAGNFIVIVPRLAHALQPLKSARFLVVDFPGINFPEDVYEDNAQLTDGSFFLGVIASALCIERQAKLTVAVGQKLQALTELAASYYLEEYPQKSYAAYTLCQNKEKWSMAILDVNEAPVHYHKIETEHFLVLNRCWKILWMTFLITYCQGGL